jgi:hypothetical protein
MACLDQQIRQGIGDRPGLADDVRPGIGINACLVAALRTARIHAVGFLAG